MTSLGPLMGGKAWSRDLDSLDRGSIQVISRPYRPRSDLVGRIIFIAYVGQKQTLSYINSRKMGLIFAAIITVGSLLLLAGIGRGAMHLNKWPSQLCCKQWAHWGGQHAFSAGACGLLMVIFGGAIYSHLKGWTPSQAKLETRHKQFELKVKKKRAVDQIGRRAEVSRQRRASSSDDPSSVSSLSDA
ncbi:MAG: hypothetical protein S4CHLAM81_00070 [Chlamydiales bacterium]|nr:hypothetical protein [Chlamydiales bacterium]MCH9634811.1 hypothetical protein [Chlamydiales bacterium]MCH9703513.1 hypothetical protein [Chlamydiota bacterium]